MKLLVTTIAVTGAAVVWAFSSPQETKPSSYQSCGMYCALILAPVFTWLAWIVLNVVRTWDAADFGYTIVAAFQLKRVKFLKSFEEKPISVMFQSRDKGNFLETNHAQSAWMPILSVESAGGKDWEKLREALLKVFSVIKWQERLQPIIDRTLANAAPVLDCLELQRIIMRVLYELVTDTEIPEKDIDGILEGVVSWTVSLSGKGVGEYDKKVYVHEYMKQAVDKMPGKPFDKDNLYIMSAIMQPLFVSPLINVPDIFAVAEENLNKLDAEEARRVLSNGVICEAFLKESLRIGHPFPIIERKVPGGILGSYQQVIRYDIVCKTGPGFDHKRWYSMPSSHPPVPQADDQSHDSWEAASSEAAPIRCPFQDMLFGTGPRRCQGQHLALKLMKSLLMHYGKNPDTFKPSKGHGISGRTNDDKGTTAQELHKIAVILKTLYKTSVVCAPLRLVLGRDCVGH